MSKLTRIKKFMGDDIMSSKIIVDDVDNLLTFFKQFKVTISPSDTAFLKELKKKYKVGEEIIGDDLTYLKLLNLKVLTTNTAGIYKESLFDSPKAEAQKMLDEMKDDE